MRQDSTNGIADVQRQGSYSYFASKRIIFEICHANERFLLFALLTGVKLPLLCFTMDRVIFDIPVSFTKIRYIPTIHIIRRSICVAIMMLL